MIRTPGILLPKQARYQLRYTPMGFILYFMPQLRCNSNSIADCAEKVNGTDGKAHKVMI